MCGQSGSDVASQQDEVLACGQSIDQALSLSEEAMLTEHVNEKSACVDSVGSTSSIRSKELSEHDKNLTSVGTCNTGEKE